MANENPQILGRYQLKHLLNSGSLGDLYQGVDTRRNLPVAIKMMHGYVSSQPEFDPHFMRVARRLSLLDHPGLVRVIDFDERDGQHYIVVDLLPEPTLTKLLETLLLHEQWLGLDEAASIVASVAEAADYAQHHKVHELDLGPDKIMFKRQPFGDEVRIQPVCVDLSLDEVMEASGHTQMTIPPTRLAYMSPEEVMGEETDQRSQVYSLGVLLHQLATGLLPHQPQKIAEAISYFESKEPLALPNHLPESMQRYLSQLLNHDPEARPPTLAAVAKTLPTLADEGWGQIVPAVASAGGFSLAQGMELRSGAKVSPAAEAMHSPVIDAKESPAVAALNKPGESGESRGGATKVDSEESGNGAEVEEPDAVSELDEPEVQGDEVELDEPSSNVVPEELVAEAESGTPSPEVGPEESSAEGKPELDGQKPADVAEVGDNKAGEVVEIEELDQEAEALEVDKAAEEDPAMEITPARPEEDPASEVVLSPDNPSEIFLSPDNPSEPLIEVPEPIAAEDGQEKDEQRAERQEKDLQEKDELAENKPAGVEEQVHPPANKASVPKLDKIQVRLPNGNVETVEILRVPIIVGRSSDCDIVLDDQRVSRKHLHIMRKESSYGILDPGSANGTFINNKRIRRDKTYRWRPDMVLQLGDHCIRLVIDGEDGGEVEWPAIAESKTKKADSLASRREHQVPQPDPWPVPVIESAVESPIYRLQERMRLSSLNETVEAADILFNHECGWGLYLPDSAINVSPDAPIQTRVVALNTAPIDQNALLQVQGLPPNWVAVSSSSLALQPNGDKKIDLRFSPPRDMHTRTGDYPVQIQLLNPAGGDLLLGATLNVQVTPFGEFQSILQTEEMVLGDSIQVYIANHSNANQSYRLLTWSDKAPVTIDPAEMSLELAPGEERTVQIETSSEDERWFGATQEYPFHVQIYPTHGQGRLHDGKFIQRSRISLFGG